MKGRGRSALLLGNYLPSLAAARSFAAAGFRVVVGDGGESSTVAHSRACDEVWKHPPIRRSDELLDALVAFLAGRPDVAVVLPLEESFVALLARHRALLPAGAIVAMPDPVTVSTCLDKGTMYRLAREEGVTCLPVATAHDLASLTASAVEVGFPCLVKPVGRGLGTLPGDRKARVCADEAALRGAFDAWPADHAELLVQRYVRAPRDNVYFVARQGTIVACIESPDTCAPTGPTERASTWQPSRCPWSNASSYSARPWRDAWDTRASDSSSSSCRPVMSRSSWS